MHESEIGCPDQCSVIRGSTKVFLQDIIYLSKSDPRFFEMSLA